MSYINFLKRAFFVSGALLMGASTYGASSSIKVPGKIDFTKISAGFSYSHNESSANGKRIGVSGRLTPNGYFYAGSIYFGENFDDCSNRGGDAVAVMPDTDREALMKLALLSFNENQTALGNVRGTNELGPQLSVELGAQMGNASITKYGPDTQKFQNALTKEIQKAFDDPKQRKNGLELSVALEKEQVIFTLTNIGQNPATIMLPDQASAHFSYRNEEHEFGGLKYAVNPSQKVIKLSPKGSFKIALMKPKNFEKSKTLFLFDNLTDVYNDNPEIESLPKVQVCSRLK